MITFLTLIHVLVSIFLVVSILLQASKGGGMAGMFGGGGAVGAVFGGRGAASFLSKITLWLGVTFALTSVSIALLTSNANQKSKSALEQVMERDQTASPADILPTVPGGSAEEGTSSPIETE
ncbi:preprotein translocase subunit SecG [candidate division KSB1 bacterium]|nr:preprotein translocase subunit SecG [candidate division KSB1 bacterium]